LSPILEHFQMLAKYNRLANKRIYGSCSELSKKERTKDRSAFFRSIHGTLNHIMIGDRIWLSRFRGETVPSTGLDEILYEDFGELWDERQIMDQRLSNFVEELEPEFLNEEVSYINNEGHRYDDPVHLLLPHLFNHETHHRGQVHDMICQTDVDSPVLDMHRVIKPEPDVYLS